MILEVYCELRKYPKKLGSINRNSCSFSLTLVFLSHANLLSTIFHHYKMIFSTSKIDVLMEHEILDHPVDLPIVLDSLFKERYSEQDYNMNWQFRENAIFFFVFSTFFSMFSWSRFEFFLSSWHIVIDRKILYYSIYLLCPIPQL